MAWCGISELGRTKIFLYDGNFRVNSEIKFSDFIAYFCLYFFFFWSSSAILLCTFAFFFFFFWSSSAILLTFALIARTTLRKCFLQCSKKFERFFFGYSTLFIPTRWGKSSHQPPYSSMARRKIALIHLQGTMAR